MAKIITLNMLRSRLDSVCRANADDGNLPLRLSLRGGSGKIVRMDIDCTTTHLQIDDDGTIIVDVRGQLVEGG